MDFTWKMILDVNDYVEKLVYVVKAIQNAFDKKFFVPTKNDFT